ncbi:TOBE domain-containing protein [Lichenicoccus sp.]|uniref:TOBE domain-containing protein n=1 Tax=Lichenicoccus sp. TaxID=2781899 RepID=UPI003D0E5AAC
MNPSQRLEVHGLRLTDDGEPVALSVGSGECVALLALPGQATPTIMSDLIDEVAGHGRASAASGSRIMVEGRDVTALPPVLRGIAILSERDPLLDHLSVRDNLGFALAARRMPAAGRHRVDQALALLGLEAEANRRPGRLDPAQRLRAALARALVGDPGVVLLDDPLGRIAPGPRHDTQLLLRRLARARGLALLLLTHDRDEALMMGERIGILTNSGLRQFGTAAELLDRPADEQVAVGFGAANSLSGRVEWVEDDVARVRLSAGPSVDAMASRDLQAGASCVVCVRPERVAVAFAAPGQEDLGGAFGGDGLAGTLSDLVHLGDHVQLRVRLAAGGEVLVRRPASQPTTGLRPGRAALLAWPPAHAVAFPLGG